MTGETVNIVCIGEIKILVAPSVPDMAFVAALFVRVDADAEIIQDIFLSYIPDAASFNIFLAFPIPVGRSHHFRMPLVVALDARCCYLLGLAEILFEL